MKYILVLIFILSYSISFSRSVKLFEDRDRKKVVSRYNALSLGGNRLLLFILMLDDTHMKKKRPNERIRIYGKLGYEADESVELIYDKKGYLKYIKGKLGYGSSSLFTFYYTSDKKITRMCGRLGIHASDELTFLYNTKGKLSEIKGFLGFDSDRSVYVKYVRNGRVAQFMRGKMGYDASDRLRFFYDKRGNLAAIQGKTGYDSQNLFQLIYNTHGNMVKIIGTPGAHASETFQLQYLKPMSIYSYPKYSANNISQLN